MEAQSLIIGGILIGALGVLAFVVGRLVHQRSMARHIATNGVTKSANLADSLRDEKLKSEIILNAIEDGVILLDDQKTIQLFNPGAAAITGWQADEALGLDFHAVIRLVDEKDSPYTEDQNPFNRVYKEALTVRDHEATLVSRSDKRISLNLSVSPLFDQNQEVNGAVAVFRDVSEERQQERQRDEFISTASHEMRTPVAAIEGYLSLALNDKVSTIDTRARSYLDKAHAATKHLGTLFQDLLTSAKAEDGRLSNHPRVVEVGECMEQLAQDLRFTAEKKGLSVELVIGSNQTIDASSTHRIIRPLYYAHVDPDRLIEVVTNLFDNAVKYTPEGKISLGLTGNDSVVQIYVRDTGPGIAREDVPHLFQKFYRVDNSATRTIGGTGLGLYICRKIIELYHGKIWVESELGKGSTFFINLPRLSTAQAEQMKAAEAAQPAT